MASKSKIRCIGILTSGGDCPGLNAAIRAIARPAMDEYGITVIGVLDGFRGLVENRTVQLDGKAVSSILTNGGTILGTSRDKLHKMPMGGKEVDMTDVAVENIKRHHLDCLVCLGGGGTQKNALRLHSETGTNVLTLPKTIDNDVWNTDITFGYDTARQIAADAIDRLHTTATSHHRIIVCEIMGHKTGWLTLGAGIAGGADVILIPELPYNLETVSDYILERRRRGKRFSIVAVAEGAISKEDAKESKKNGKSKNKSKSKKKKPDQEVLESLEDLDSIESDSDGKGALVVRRVKGELKTYHIVREPIASRIARQLQELTGIDARVTSLGHVQRGGIPSAYDRVLCTRLGTTAAQMLAAGEVNCMVAVKGTRFEAVDLDDVAGKRKTVPIEDPMIESARMVGTCMGVSD
jgi:6-phosphofructokinase 1